LSLTFYKDDTTYDTVFQTTSGDTLILRVNIPLQSSFAASCPSMTLAGVKVRHPWVDSSNNRTMRIIGYDPIQSEKAWKESKIKLGEAVHAVVKHLQLNPPQILEITDKGLQSIQSRKNGKSSRITTPTRNGVNGANQSAAQQQHNDAPPSYNIVSEATPAPEVPLPNVPSKYSETEGLSRQQLDELVDDELEFMRLIYKLPVYDKIFTIGSSRLNENVQLARDNLSHESKLAVLQGDVKRLHQTLQTKLAEFSKLEARQNAICAPPDLAETLQRLNKAKKEAFDESEAMAEAWVDGDSGSSVDDFCKQFLESRKVHHMRAAKMEILKNTPDRQEV
jgi:ESCRT-I complex subunit VPS37